MDWVQVGKKDELVSAARNRSLSLPTGSVQTLALHAVAEEIGPAALVVRVPEGLDAASLVPLLIADQCGEDALRETSAALIGSGPTAAFHALQRRLERRYLLVDSLDRLRHRSAGWDLSAIHADAFDSLYEWLRGQASGTTGTGTEGADVTARCDPHLDTSLLWKRVSQDPDRFALAVSRSLLRGSIDSARGWNEEELIADLWDDMPSAHRRLVALLAVHGRPVLRSLFERLGLVAAEVIARAHDLALVEIRSGWISVPKPWYSDFSGFEARELHRTLADAFAGLAIAMPEHANGICVLEAHRHYAAVPDAKRALSFASHGASALLEAAVRQSKSGHWSEAGDIYGAYLELDRREPTIRDETHKVRARAYATHYLHFNRERGGQEPVTDTLQGYRSALRDWPENALFWHRLVQVSFEAEEEGPAMAALREAQTRVPAHPERERTLVVRTVDRLLSTKRLLAAVFVWGDHEPVADADRLVKDQLIDDLAKGTRIRRLWADGIPAITLDTPVEVQASRAVTGEWVCEVGGHRRVGHSLCSAVRSAVLAAALNDLADRWRRDTGGMSIAAQRIKHAAWQQILAMGSDVVPELLRRAEKAPDHWHAAFTALTGENPIPAGAKITVSQACAAWVEWGRARGLIE